MKMIRAISGIALIVVALVGGYCLMVADMLSGSEFVTLVIAFAVIGIALVLSDEIKELSIGGNIIRFKEAKKGAEEAISELRTANRDTYRALLWQTKNHPGCFSDGSTIDERLSNFWSVYSSVVSLGLKEELRPVIADVANELIRGQLNCIGNNSDKVLEQFQPEDTPDPSTLAEVAFSPESVSEAARRGVYGGSEEKIRRAISEGIAEYQKLYELPR